jgi:hypothetical protein
MGLKNLEIKLSKHAYSKSKERNIPFSEIEETVLKPDYKKIDKFDETLVHFIRKNKTRYLRVIGKYLSEQQIFIISVFYDRRLKKETDK